MESQAELAQALDAERRRVEELRQMVADARQKVSVPQVHSLSNGRLRSSLPVLQVRKLDRKRRTIEDNMSRLYDTAKRKIDESSQLLSITRRQVATSKHGGDGKRSRP